MNEFKNQHLLDVLESHRMNHIADKMEKYLTKRDEVKAALQKKYGYKLVVRAINSGSYAKHTAINTKFDIDICQPFSKNSFTTLEQMADDVHDFFKNEYEDDDLIEVKKQRVSTGIIFLIDNEEVPMDVTPGRELVEGGYKDDQYLNLYVRAKGDKPATQTQTNISKHIDLIKGKVQERRIIRLLKIWKNKHSPNIKSFFMELITIKAFEANSSNLPKDQWGKLEMTMKYIRDNVKTIKLIDPANSSNTVSNTMTDSEKRQLSEDTDNALTQIEHNENRISYYFSVNEKFVEKEEKSGIKKSSVIPTVHFS